MGEYDKFASTVVQIGIMGAAGAWLLKRLVGDKLDSINSSLEKLTQQMGSAQLEIGKIQVKQEYHERWLEQMQDEISGKTRVQ